MGYGVDTIFGLLHILYLCGLGSECHKIVRYNCLISSGVMSGNVNAQPVPVPDIMMYEWSSHGTQTPGRH